MYRNMYPKVKNKLRSSRFDGPQNPYDFFPTVYTDFFLFCFLEFNRIAGIFPDKGIVDA